MYRGHEKSGNVASRSSIVILVAILCTFISGDGPPDRPWLTNPRLLDEDYANEQDYSREWLRSEPLDSKHLRALIKPMAEHITKYEIELVCADHYSRRCVSHRDNITLTLDYLETAIKGADGRMTSRVWRDITDDSIYGALIILDPKTVKSRRIRKLLKASNAIRDRCTRHVIGKIYNENLRYFRVHLDTNNDLPIDSKNKMLRQFVDESMKQYFCSEYIVGGEHTVPIYPREKAKKFFLPYGFQKYACGTSLLNTCKNDWFGDRCLMTKRVSSQSCPESYSETYDVRDQDTT